MLRQISIINFDFVMLATVHISYRQQRVQQSIKALHHSWKIFRSMLNILAHKLQKKPLKYVEHALIIYNRMNLFIMIVAAQQIFHGVNDLQHEQLGISGWFSARFVCE
jgi:hypothetical protein